MTEGELLLRGVLLNPADDTARLVYADWLQENGDEERAEFVRVQCELARMPDCGHKNPWPGAVSDCPRCTLFRRQGVLLGRKDAIPWRALGYGQAPRKAMSRGFISEVDCSLETFIHHVPALFAAHPIEKVTLTDRRPWQGSVGGYIWESDQRTGYNLVTRAYVIPEVLYRYNVFTTEADAHAWLSAQCVNYGRALAGLPSIGAPVHSD